MAARVPKSDQKKQFKDFLKPSINLQKPAFWTVEYFRQDKKSKTWSELAMCPDGWTPDDRVPAAIALEVRVVHLTESPESSSHCGNQLSLMALGQIQSTGKTKLLLSMNYQNRRSCCAVKIVRCNSHWDLKSQQIGHTFRKIKHYLKYIFNHEKEKKCITKSRINGHSRITRQKDLWSVWILMINCFSWLRYNVCIMSCTCFKCIIQWVLVNLLSFVTTTI